MKKALVAATLVLSLNRPAMAAGVAIIKDHAGEQAIEISGRIEKGDLLKVKQISSRLMLSLPDGSLDRLQFYLNTGGGDLDEAMQIGRFFREVLAGVNVYGNVIIAPGSDDEKRLMKAGESAGNLGVVVAAAGASLNETQIVRNYSAGILIFYGAVQRSQRDNVDRRAGGAPRAIPVMGIHRPYYDREFFGRLSPSKAAEAYKTLERTVRGYLSEMGAPQALVDRMFASPSDKVELVPATEFEAFYQHDESFLEEWLIAKCSGASKTPASRGLADVSTKVGSRNSAVQDCRDGAISAHQQDWARRFRSGVYR